MSQTLSDMKEYVIGFDARVPIESQTNSWSVARRYQFLINENAQTPCSADYRVYPSIFGDEGLLPYSRQKMRRQRLLSELHEVELILAAQNHFAPILCTIVGFTMLLDEESADEHYAKIFPCDPDTVQPQWRFLGWDVAEHSLLSGLMNMGYRTDDNEKEFAVKHFANSLNNYHLFEQADIALQFAEWVKTRDPGHGGPFYVCGIYEIGVLIGN